MIKTYKYDLEERTAVLGENIVKQCKKVNESTVNKPIITQLVKSGTSIGANYCEANGASSKSDFRNKIHICKKEAIETKFWLRILSTSAPELKDECQILWKEAQELTLIFSKILGSLKSKN